MGYIKKNLLPGETIVHQTELHWKIFIVPIVFLFFGGFLYWKGWIFLAYTLGGSGGVSLVAALLRYFTNEFAITQDTLILRQGVFPSVTQIPLKQIENVKIRIRYLGLILGYGTLSYSSGSAREEFKAISGPDEFCNRARQQLNHPQPENQGIHLTSISHPLSTPLTRNPVAQPQLQSTPSKLILNGWGFFASFLVFALLVSLLIHGAQALGFAPYWFSESEGRPPRALVISVPVVVALYFFGRNRYW